MKIKAMSRLEEESSTMLVMDTLLKMNEMCGVSLGVCAWCFVPDYGVPHAFSCPSFEIRMRTVRPDVGFGLRLIVPAWFSSASASSCRSHDFDTISLTTH